MLTLLAWGVGVIVAIAVWWLIGFEAVRFVSGMTAKEMIDYMDARNPVMRWLVVFLWPLSVKKLLEKQRNEPQ